MSEKLRTVRIEMAPVPTDTTPNYDDPPPGFLVVDAIIDPNSMIVGTYLLFGYLGSVSFTVRDGYWWQPFAMNVLGEVNFGWGYGQQPGDVPPPAHRHAHFDLRDGPIVEQKRLLSWNRGQYHYRVKKIMDLP
jgi:hypothetical protein